MRFSRFILDVLTAAYVLGCERVAPRLLLLRGLKVTLPSGISFGDAERKAHAPRTRTPVACCRETLLQRWLVLAVHFLILSASSWKIGIRH